MRANLNGVTIEGTPAEILELLKAVATTTEAVRPSEKRKSKRAGTRHKSSWSSFDDDVLRENYARNGARYVAKMTGKKIGSVYARAQKLGVHKWKNGARK